MIKKVKKIKQKIRDVFSAVKKEVVKTTGDDVSYIYDEDFASRPWRDKGYKYDFKNILMDIYNPSSVIDIGCGTGDLLYPFMEDGVDVIGVDGSRHCYKERKIPENKFIISDIRYDNLDFGEFDLCMCLEVAEHIEEKYSKKLVDTLTDASKNIVFTAATPGQGGVNHVNEKPHSWWIDKFEEFGYELKKRKAEQISNRLGSINHKSEHDKRSVKNYVNNMMVFEGSG